LTKSTTLNNLQDKYCKIDAEMTQRESAGDTA